MRKFLLMSALILGMAALTTTEVGAQQDDKDDLGSTYTPETPLPPRPGTHPYPGGPTPWDWKPWPHK